MPRRFKTQHRQSKETAQSRTKPGETPIFEAQQPSPPEDKIAESDEERRLREAQENADQDRQSVAERRRERRDRIEEQQRAQEQRQRAARRERRNRRGGDDNDD